MTYASPTNLSSLSGIFQYAHSVAPTFGIAIIIMTAVIFFLAMKERFTASRAFAGTAFITFLVSVYLRVLGMIPDYIMTMVVGGLIVAIIWLVSQQD